MDKARTQELPAYACKWLTDSAFGVVVPHGELKASFYEQIGHLYIHDVHVSPAHRRQGIGKNLLAIVEKQAAALGATAIRASIVSREAIDAAIAFFGPDAVTVEHLGQYDQDRRPPHLRTGTRAWLHHEIPAGAES